MKSVSMRRGAVLAAVCMTALTLAACGQSENKTTGNPLENAVASVSGQAEAENEKFNAYTDAFNTLIDDNWGVASNLEKYTKQNIPTANASSNIHFFENASSLERALTKLKEGRALKGGSASTAADAAADKVIASGEKLLAQWKELTPYYETRAYREDGLAKGKAAHDSLVANYNTTIAAINELDAALTTYLRARSDKRIADFRKAGHEDAANVTEAMQIADYFSSAVIEENIAEADRLLPQLDAALTKLRASEAAMPADNSNKTEFDLINGYLSSMIGAWRDYKQSPDDRHRENVVDQYNRAIDQMDDIEFPA